MFRRGNKTGAGGQKNSCYTKTVYFTVEEVEGYCKCLVDDA